MPVAERVAIVGMATRFPASGADLDEFWQNVVTGTDCSRDVPEGRWLLAPESCYDSRVPHPDSVYSRRGYYLDPFVAAVEDLDIPPDLLAGLDPLFHLILDVGYRAWKAAKTGSVDRRKVGVILGNICLPTEKSSNLAREYLGGQIARVIGITPESPITHPLNRYVAGLPGGLLAKALGLGGGTFTLDAACASSIYALKLACDELLSNRADVMLAGGASRPDCLYTQMGFAQLRALSTSGRCSPFDANADGLVVGEGAGIFVLKRLSDAIRHGDTIHGVICGIGLSNDMHGNLLAPAKEGQLRAMHAAYAQAGWKNQFADFIECHATGTPVGDAVEFESLRELWGEEGWKTGQCVLGSVKSTVGHLLTGAGAAALTKVLLAMANRTRPPQANFASPNPNFDYANGPFRVLQEPEIWDPRRPTLPRRAAVSGFGFGGVNGHLLVEEYVGQTYTSTGTSSLLKSTNTRTTPSQHSSRLMTKLNEIRQRQPGAMGGPGATLNGEPTGETPEPIAVVGLATHFGPWETVRSFQEFVLGGSAKPEPKPKQTGWQSADRLCPPGYYIETLTTPLDRFRIPPIEIEEMLPQQLLMLNVAAAALDDCKTSAKADADDPRAGVFIGLGLDLNTTNFHLRWSAKQKVDAINPPRKRVFVEGQSQQPRTLDEWRQDLVESVSPPLNANRTMGALGSIAASRIARAFHFGGPSFTLCSEETSSARAIELAVRALRSNELDRAIVGGVDLAGDPRSLLATAAQRPFAANGTTGPLETTTNGVLPCEGAAAVVLKRLADAVRDGDRVYAVIRGVGTASGGAPESLTPDAAAYASSLIRACTDAMIDPATVEYLEVASTGAAGDDRTEAEALAALLQSQPRPVPVTLTSVRGQIGHAGAAAPLAGFVKACLALHHQVLPATVAVESARAELTPVTARCHNAKQARFWLRDQSSPPRRAMIAAIGVDGSVVHIVLEEHATVADPSHHPDRMQPLGARPEAVFAVEADTAFELVTALSLLENWADSRQSQPIEFLARRWLKQTGANPTKRLAVALVARSVSELQEQIDFAQESLQNRPDVAIPAPNAPELRSAFRDRVFYTPAPLGERGKVAFVFPGSGNHFAGMGRDLGVQWPEILRRQQPENANLFSQYTPNRFWNETIPAMTTAKEFLFGQVTLGTLTADLLTHLGVQATAMIGQSLGESAGLFGMRVWRDRDEMLKRIQQSSLFATDLAPPYDAARNFWGLTNGESVDWVSGVMTLPADDIRAAMRPGLHAYLLIVTTPTECVIGGLRADVEKLVTQFPSGKFFPLNGVTLAHCELGRPVEQAYRALHTLPTTPPANLTVYSGAYGRAYKPTPESAADSITAGLLDTIDFPAVVEAAYKDGVRFFLEVGPGNSTTRMIAAILTTRPHVARAICVARQDNVSLVLRCVANLIAERAAVDLGQLYGTETRCAGHQDVPVPSKMVLKTRVGLLSEMPPLPPWITPPPVVRSEPISYPEILFTPEPINPDTSRNLSDRSTGSTVLAALLAEPDVDLEPASLPVTPMPRPSLDADDLRVTFAPFVDAAEASQAGVAAAHDSYLQLQTATATTTATLSTQTAYITRLLGGFDDDDDPELATPTPASRSAWPSQEPPRSLSTDDCFRFAAGKIGDVLGPTFAPIDAFPTRVRLPDGPLMLVDHVRSIDGEPLSLKSGRVVTDHTVHAGRWYLDAGRCPTSVTVESGQADLFLAGFLGIDFQTQGVAVYRLLDAVVTFHRGLPKVGEMIVYDIHIDEFFNQADAWLFRFRFEGSVNGEPLLSMQNGVAGFFTQAALAAGQGIVQTKLDKQPFPGKKPADWTPLVPFAVGSLSPAQVQALHRGDLVTAFGADFAKLQISHPMTLPSGMLRLLDQVSLLDPNGGRFGLGFVRGEYAIQPKEWFIECHFIDDKVMPGTLMFECCLHTLRVLLMRMGWVGGDGEVVCEPKPGVKSRLKCRGQVLETTGIVTYEVSVKEIGYAPEPYCIADALMYADGKPIVEITNLSLRMAGLTREKLAQSWGQMTPGSTIVLKGFASPKSLKPAIYDKAKILAYSNGNPSEAFDEPYKIFDQGRILARLPGPPYQFLDRITAVTGEPFVLKAGAACVAEYDVPPDAWFFESNRSTRMPFSILLEIALQPCGWLAAYCGSALTSPNDLSFRNLGGQATQFVEVTPDIGTLTTHVAMTQVSNSAGMIIQHYTMLVMNRDRKVYEGTTYFGFFATDALKNQVGMPTAKVPYISATQMALPDFESDRLPHTAPFPMPMMRMIDRIDGYLPTGGRKGLGIVQGRIAVDPSFWFFKAHFYQDPVWPGSLGLESFLQLLKYAAWKRWKVAPTKGWQTVALNQKHEWTYRGQVVPTDRDVKVVLEITAVDDTQRRMTANGFLTVDGRIIYQMTGFTLE